MFTNRADQAEPVSVAVHVSQCLLLTERCIIVQNSHLHFAQFYMLRVRINLLFMYEIIGKFLYFYTLDSLIEIIGRLLVSDRHAR